MNEFIDVECSSRLNLPLLTCLLEPTPTVHISASRQGSRYEICVDDNGPGVPQQISDQVFEPYMTTKDTGTGLGLAIVKKVVIDHGGDIEMLVSPLGGARLRLSLPAA